MVNAVLGEKPNKDLILVTGRIHPRLAEDVTEQFDIDVLGTTTYDFINGETYVRYTELARGVSVFVLQSHYKSISKAIVGQLVVINALKRASARSITAVCPLLGYFRRDEKRRDHKPISYRLVFDLLKTTDAGHIMSVNLHATQSQDFFDGPVDHLMTIPVLVDYIRDRFQDHLNNVAVISPDAGRVRVAKQWARRLDGSPLAFVHGTHDATHPNQVVANRVVGDVTGKDCVLVDGLIDTAGTIAGACHVLQDAGAKSVTVVATHGVLSGPAIERLKNYDAREVVLTDTVPVPGKKRWDGLTVLPIALLLASAVRTVFEDGSVAELFDTYPEHHDQGFLFA